MSNNLTAILTRIRSDKVKERQDGIEGLRNFFRRDETIADFYLTRDGGADPKQWLIVFQSLFEALLSEKESYRKKETAAAATRLRNAASAVRWLVEKTAQYMNKRVANAVFDHLIQAMIWKNALSPIIPLEYIQALKAMVEWSPHLEHMSDELWIRIVELGFNVVLCEPLRKHLEDDQEEDDQSAGEASQDSSDAAPAAGLSSKKRALPRSFSPSKKRSPFPSVQPNPEAPTPEQISFTSLLTIMLGYDGCPLLAESHSYLADSILRRLHQFLSFYPTDSSLHNDYLVMLSSTLSHLALNKKASVIAFTHSSWKCILGLWGTKNRTVKESLVAVIRTLLPFLTAEQGSEVAGQGLRRLWNCLDGEADSRWSSDPLSTEALRLEIVDPDDPHDAIRGKRPFIYHTFRYGWHFGANEALTWATLELQADCAEKLYQLSESMHVLSPSVKASKRRRLENPIQSILATISGLHANAASSRAIYHLQLLLVLMERHWSRLHKFLRQQIMATLQRCISVEDEPYQTWAFLGLASVAYQESRPENQSISRSEELLPGSQTESFSWENVWAHTIRRVTVPAVCRGACHLGHVLIQVSQSSNSFLSRQSLLTDIESISRDLDVHGPVYPFDSVCAFLVSCLKIANQDARLYRAQMEDKVLAWLIGCWNIRSLASTDSRTRGSSRSDWGGTGSYNISDILTLLESVCILPHVWSPAFRVILPSSQIMQSVLAEEKTQVIRQFLLDGVLPTVTTSHSDVSRGCKPPLEIVEHISLSVPTGRQHRCSAFLLQVTEDLVSQLEGDALPPLSAEKARRILDIALIELYFETILAQNGKRSNRKGLQTASRLVAIIISAVRKLNWSAGEKALVLLGLEPLTACADDDENAEGHWMAMLPPGPGSGLKRSALWTQQDHFAAKSKQRRAHRRATQRMLWRSSDVQDGLSVIYEELREIIRGQVVISHSHQNAQDADGFGAVMSSQDEDTASAFYIFEVAFLHTAVSPILQTSTTEATRDDELLSILLQCGHDDPRRFLSFSAVLVRALRQGSLSLTVDQFDGYLNLFGDLLTEYKFSRHEPLQTAVASFLDATYHIWSRTEVALDEPGEKTRSLCDWFSESLLNQKVRTWTARDQLALFMDHYLFRDPNQKLWSVPGDSTKEEMRRAHLPSNVLPCLNGDRDIRVRFRAAVINANLFTVARQVDYSPFSLYEDMLPHYTTEQDAYEHMLTRLISLGNIMVVDCSLRAGPYWHLLEVCLNTTQFMRHVQSVLTCACQNLGFPSLSIFFKGHGSEIAYTIRHNRQDLLRIPPHILGYPDRAQCARAAFRIFTPINLLRSQGDGPIIGHGEKLFAAHCKLIKKEVTQGIAECFGDIVGLQTIASITDNGSIAPQDLVDTLMQQTKLASREDFLRTASERADSVICAILRLLGDCDCSADGAIFAALQGVDSGGLSAADFLKMTKFCHQAGLTSQSMKHPAYGAPQVISSLQWFLNQVQVSTQALVYHVLQLLFAEIHGSALVNDQSRLLTSIALWVALNTEHFQETNLLHILLHGMLLVLQEPDLAPAAQSMLDWALYRHPEHLKGSHLPSIFSKISRAIHAYPSHDTSQNRLGKNLMKWATSHAQRLLRIPALRPFVVKAVLVWPDSDFDEIATNEGTVKVVSELLSQESLAASNFRLVKKLEELSGRGDYSTVQFAAFDFWRLKRVIPKASLLHKEDVAALAALLIRSHGTIRGFGNVLYHHLITRDPRHRVPYRGKELSPPNPVLAALLSLLRGDDATDAHHAYTTLRSLMSVWYQVPVQAPLPQDSLAEIELLKQFSPTPEARSVRNVEELRSDSFSVQSSANYKLWIAELTTLLCDILTQSNPIFSQLPSILKTNASFAESMLPWLTHAFLLQFKDSEAHSIGLSEYLTSVLSFDDSSVDCSRSILDVILYLRQYPPPHGKGELAYNRWLGIDYHLLASKATECGLYTTALLFLEIASDNPRHGSAKGTRSTEDIMFDIYAHIDEPDGFYGIKTSSSQNFLLQRFHHEQQWEKAFRFHGASLESGSHTARETSGLLNAYHAFGFNKMAMQALLASSVDRGDNSSSSVMMYELGWRTETWDLPEVERSPGPKHNVYSVLRSVHCERDPRSTRLVVEHALVSEAERLRSLGNENLSEIREVAQNLMCIDQVVRWTAPAAQAALLNRSLSSLDWSAFTDVDSDFEFDSLEKVVAVRISLIRSARLQEERGRIGNLEGEFTAGLLDLEKSCLLQLSKAAREADQVQIALNAITRAQRLEKAPSFEVAHEFANVLWAQSERKMGLESLKRLLFSNQDAAPAELERAKLLASLGAWASDARLEKPSDIMEQYFDPAIKLIEVDESPEAAASRSTIYHQYATFAERQYHSIVNSPDTARWKLYMDRKNQELETRRSQLSQYSQNSNEQVALQQEQRKAQRQLQSDTEIFNKHNRVLNTTLHRAVDMYSRCLETSDQFDDDGPIRLCSLWFSNFSNSAAQDNIRVALSRVPSRKLVFLAHQISARLTGSQSETLTPSQACLRALLLRMCSEHPFHSLYQVYSLQSDIPQSSNQPNKRRQSGRLDTNFKPTERGAAAAELMSNLRTNETCGERVRNLERVCRSYLEWAKHPIKNDSRYDSKKQSSPFTVPLGLSILKLQEMDIPIPTIRIPIDLTLKYDDCVSIHSYESTFSTAGGVNLPKISICIGSDGRKYKQLFKGEGEDDLRQDAVMEQVFDLCNRILRRDKMTSKRGLRVRAYTVLPLSSQAGVLEFVHNTTPLGSWLNAAHVRYHPTDIKPSAASSKLKDFGKAIQDKRVAALNWVRERFRPVMRHYFSERTREPMVWFTMRLCYSRSVATTSIIGHILGLGDRHTSNILLDNSNGEVVHIDLGIAFDQGKALPVPERVPFRLTADMVDGLVSCATQGVFQRCAEETLRVMRDDSPIVMTVLEVFKHDPLHSWTASEIKVKKLQPSGKDATALNDAARLGIELDMSSGNAAENADRALSSVARKLDKTMSVEFTVNELIAEATDVRNLGTVYFGWGPHL